MSSAIIPIPKTDVSVREATPDDLPFIDGLQKMHSKMVGFMHRATLEGKIAAREVIVAEDAARNPIGYCIGTDRYFKHDDVGIIYHLNVSPGKQRGFVGATLLRAMFERAAYGCRLFCCWCAQDIAANRFWEAMGFVPLAYRAGSEKKVKGGRVHIFWQKRIRAGDTTTPWWFPSQTTGGAIREDRLVLPIPPGVRWCDEMPVMVLPALSERQRVEGPKESLVLGHSSLVKDKGQRTRDKGHAVPPAPKRAAIGRAATLTFAPPAPLPMPTTEKTQKPKRERKPKRKNDPKLIAAARELRDRWLEQVNSGTGAYVLEDAGKYDVARALPERPAVPLLPAA